MAASITGKAAERIVAPLGKTLKELQTALDSENPHAEKGWAVTNSAVKLAIELEQEKQTDRNVVGIVRGATREYVMLGAHYDPPALPGSSRCTDIPPARSASAPSQTATPTTGSVLPC